MSRLNPTTRELCISVAIVMVACFGWIMFCARANAQVEDPSVNMVNTVSWIHDGEGTAFYVVTINKRRYSFVPGNERHAFLPDLEDGDKVDVYAVGYEGESAKSLNGPKKGLCFKSIDSNGNGVIDLPDIGEVLPNLGTLCFGED